MSWTAGRSATVIGRIRSTRRLGTLTARPPVSLDGVVAGGVTDAARERHVLGYEPGEVVCVARREAGRARAASIAAPARRGRRRPARPRRPVRGRQVDAPRAARRRELRIRAAGQDPRQLARPRQHPVRRAGGLEQDDRSVHSVRAAAARSALAGRDADDRQPQRVGEPLGGRDPHAQPGERPWPGPDDEAAERRRRRRRDRASSPRSGRGAPRRGGSRRPRSAPRSARPSGAPRAMTARVVAVSMTSSGPPAVTPPPRGTGHSRRRPTAARSGAARRRCRR